MKEKRKSSVTPVNSIQFSNFIQDSKNPTSKVSATPFDFYFSTINLIRHAETIKNLQEITVESAIEKTLLLAEKQPRVEISPGNLLESSTFPENFFCSSERKASMPCQTADKIPEKKEFALVSKPCKNAPETYPQKTVRENIQLTVKIFVTEKTFESDILTCVEKILHQLNTKFIDLLLLSFESTNFTQFSTFHFLSLWKRMEALVSEQKLVHKIGVCNIIDTNLLKILCDSSHVRPSVIQIHISQISSLPPKRLTSLTSFGAQQNISITTHSDLNMFHPNQQTPAQISPSFTGNVFSQKISSSSYLQNFIAHHSSSSSPSHLFFSSRWISCFTVPSKTDRC
eukprot:Sdes_comp20756_c0_seq1m16725